MADVMWIKVLTNIRNNKKMKLIKAMPEVGDALFCMWIDLICMAGEVADGGYVYLTDGRPYDEEELAVELNRPVQMVRLAIETFNRYNMISIDDNGILLKSFAEIQDIESMERIRQLGAARQRKLREKRRYLPGGDNKQNLLAEDNINNNSCLNNDVTLPSRYSNGRDKIREDNIREEVEIDNNINLINIWENVKGEIKKNISLSNYNLLIQPACLFELTENEAVIGCNNETNARHMESNMRQIIERSICNVTGYSVAVKFVLIE